MNTELKVDVVEFLTRDEGDENDREAAKLVAGMTFDTRHHEGLEMDVLIGCEPERVSRAKSSDLAGRIENAVRRAAPGRVRQLQWVEQRTGDSPRAGTGAGTGPVADQPPYRNSAPHPSKPPFPRDIRAGSTDR